MASNRIKRLLGLNSSAQNERTLARKPKRNLDPSLFSKSELEGFFSLADAQEKKAGTIRGPLDKWTIRGNVLCGHHTSINGQFKASGRVRIGSYCAFGQLVGLLASNHRTDMVNQQVWFSQRFDFKLPVETSGPIEIGHNVWIGDKATVLSGVKVGHGSVVAAGATVTRSVGPFEIVGGTPARRIRKRFTDAVIEQLLEIRWWDWPEEVIRQNKTFFETEIPPDQDIDLRGLVNL